MKWSKSCLLAGIISVSVILLVALTACGGASETTITTGTTTTSITPAMPSRPPEGSFSDNRTPPSMDLATAAEKLGVTEEKLRQALENSGQGLFDMAQAATTLWLTEEELQEALGFTHGVP